MGFYNIIIKYRFWLSLLAVALGLGLELTGIAGFWPVFHLYSLSVISLLLFRLQNWIKFIFNPL